MCHFFKLYHIFQEKNMPYIAKNAKKQPRHWVWHNKTQDIYAFIHRATFIHKFICDFLMVSSTYESKKQPPALGVASLAGIFIRYRNRMQKIYEDARYLCIKEADALQVLRYDT